MQSALPGLMRSMFQSSPGPKAECYAVPRVAAHRPDRVSILTRPEGRVLLGLLGDVVEELRVSILTRPEGRVLQSRSARRGGRGRCFNPHPARRPSATVEGVRRNGGSGKFQSSPGPKAECYAAGTWFVVVVDMKFQSSPGPKAECYGDHGAEADAVVGVSILTRPEGRVLRRVHGARPAVDAGFNPHPARRPSATRPPPSRGSHRPGFNPHPARRPSATRGIPGRCACSRSFQSSPGPKAECYKARGFAPL